MKDILKNVLTILVVAAIGLLIGRYLLGSDEDLKKARDQIARTQALVDSLKQVNATIAANLARVEQHNQELEQEKNLLAERLQRQLDRLNRMVKEINAYVGAKTELVRELNLILDAPLRPLPN